PLCKTRSPRSFCHNAGWFCARAIAVADVGGSRVERWGRAHGRAGLNFSGPVAAILTCRLATCTRPDRQWSGRNKGGVNGKACLGRVGGGRSGHSARRVRCHELSLRVQSRKNRLGWADLWGRVGGCRLLQGARAVLPVRGHPQPHVVAGLGSWGGVGRSTG